MVMKSKSKVPPGKEKTERLEARISVELKELLTRAAMLEGNTLTNFVLRAAANEARRVIRETEAIRLSARDQEAFVKALLNPPKPNRKLKEAARFYKEQFKA